VSVCAVRCLIRPCNPSSTSCCRVCDPLKGWASLFGRLSLLTSEPFFAQCLLSVSVRAVRRLITPNNPLFFYLLLLLTCSILERTLSLNFNIFTMNRTPAVAGQRLHSSENPLRLIEVYLRCDLIRYKDGHTFRSEKHPHGLVVHPYMHAFWYISAGDP